MTTDGRPPTAVRCTTDKGKDCHGFRHLKPMGTKEMEGVWLNQRPFLHS